MKLFLSSILLSFLLTNCGNIPDTYKRPRGNPSYGTSNSSEGPIRFRFIDVGQGDATIITTPNGKNILIDSGTSEMGRERVLPILNNLELIIASHFDFDHIGGIPEIIKGMDGIINSPDDIIPALGVLDRGESTEINKTHFFDYWVTLSDLRYSIKSGDSFFIDGVKFTILGQNGDFGNHNITQIDNEFENAKSLSLLVSYNGLTYLTSGDLPGPNFPNQYEPYNLEQNLARLVEDIDILHVSHHGSHNSTSQTFAEALGPAIAIISVGENSYGHPHSTVIQNLLAVGSDIYLTEGNWIEDKTDLNIINGDICLESDGIKMQIGKCD